MIPIVEDYLSELIQSKLDYLKNNPDQIGNILGASQARIDRLKNFIANNPIKVIKGYPRTPADLPSICILLSGEGETQEGLGDYENMDDDDIREATVEVEVIDRVGGKLEMPYVELPYKPIVEVSSIVHNDFGTTLQGNDYAVEDPDLGLVGFYTGLVEDGDTLTVTFTYRNTSVDLTQVLYEANYRLEVWASNADLVVELYHLLKWALLSGRDYLGSDKDIIRQRLGGADFEPAPNYFPEFVYRRALTFWCQFSVSAPNDEEIGYVQSVVVNQSEYPSVFGGGDE
jgi:hypothetical protein